MAAMLFLTMKTHLTVLLLLLSLVTFAVPAKRVWRTVRMTDGRECRVQLVGDEFHHYWLNENDQRMEETETGLFCISERSTVEPAAAQARRVQANARRERRRMEARGVATGRKRGIVILINYTDRAMVHTQQEFDAMFNENNYNKNGHIGSLADYFYDQSYGQLSLQFDVVGPYTLSNAMAFYGKDSGGSGEDIRPGEMVAEAIMLADKAGTDFSQYDWNGDGCVDQVFVVYAGYGQAAGGPNNSIWPHEWDLTSALGSNIQLDGVTIDTYACSAELKGGSGTRMDGIGTAAHEFSHCLGLPDFYDTSGAYSPAPGMDVWSLMDYGCYNNGGSVPCGYTAYERWYSGWLTPTELDEGCMVEDMHPITETPEAYIIYNKANRNEYYILANHQKQHDADCPYHPWNSYAPGHGMLVLHVDYDATAWYDNTPNNVKSHQRMTIVPANGTFYFNSSTRELAGHPYPGTSGNTSLTDTSKPAASLFNRNSDGKLFLNHPIEDIREEEGLISFRFNGGGETSVYPPLHQDSPKYDGIYNLAGQRIARPPKGVYIENGKKRTHP